MATKTIKIILVARVIFLLDSMGLYSLPSEAVRAAGEGTKPETDHERP